MTGIKISRSESVRKLLRFIAIYGPGRSLFKVAGRLRFKPISLRPNARRTDIGLIGCGQFGFATIGYFLQREFGPRIAACHDIDPAAANTLARALRVPQVCDSAEALFAAPGLRTVYIASNHASHASYASSALRHGLDVYVEKPIAVERSQLIELLRAKRQSGGRIFAGYNRPFSAAIQLLRVHTTIDTMAGISLQCFVSGHQIGPDHWYRRPDEGTRVCGNIGHWLDLMVHILAWRGLPDRLDISATWADDSEPDDNVSITMRSDRSDLVSVMLTSRSEPFEGINETINFQHGETTCKIDDFRQMVIWQGANLFKRRFWPKDVGHRLAILQPWATGPGRDWHEVELSTLLMLHITDMVRSRTRSSAFSFSEQWSAIESLLVATDPGAAPSPSDTLQVS